MKGLVDALDLDLLGLDEANVLLGVAEDTLGDQDSLIRRFAHQPRGSVDLSTHNDVVGTDLGTDFATKAITKRYSERKVAEFQLLESILHPHGTHGRIEAWICTVAMCPKDRNEDATLVIEGHFLHSTVAAMCYSRHGDEHTIHLAQEDGVPSIDVGQIVEACKYDSNGSQLVEEDRHAVLSMIRSSCCQGSKVRLGKRVDIVVQYQLVRCLGVIVKFTQELSGELPGLSSDKVWQIWQLIFFPSQYCQWFADLDHS
mmetsp:Transcript_31255/g.91535  ORF Transcript_31255/g.91535 Transcript_31255/m.91535 type:complete len:257 (-) Transcript_31255:3097-3867(-)